MDVVEVIVVIAFILGCALFAFYVVYTTRWVLQNAIEIGIALGFLLGIYLAVTNANSFATGAPLVALLVLACASIGFLLRCTFFISGLIEERAPLTAMRDFWKPSTAYIHVVGAWQYANVAIVRAKQADEGLRQLQQGCPRRLRVLASFAFDNERQAIAGERTIRKKLRPMRNRGEWYTVDLETVLSTIASLPGVVPMKSSKLAPMTRPPLQNADLDKTEARVATNSRSEPR